MTFEKTLSEIFENRNHYIHVGNFKINFVVVCRLVVEVFFENLCDFSNALAWVNNFLVYRKFCLWFCHNEIIITQFL